MLDKTYLTTGDLVKIVGTTKNTLFHYDKLGLFRPAVVRENGYRAYAYWQIDQFLSIAYLRKIGMPLKEIRAYMENRDPARLETLLQSQLEKVRAKIRELGQIERFLEEHLHQFRQLRDVDFGRIFIERQEEETIYCSPEILWKNEKEGLVGLGEFFSEGVTIMNCLGAVLDVHGIQEGAGGHPRCFFVRSDGQASGAGHWEKKPAGDYLVAYQQGMDIGESYQRMLDFAAAHHLTFAREGYEEYILNELDVTDSSQYVTRVSFLLADE